MTFIPLVPRFDNLHRMDGTEPPINIDHVRQVFCEMGGAGFTVNRLDAHTISGSQPLQFHVASAGWATPGVVIIPVVNMGGTPYLLVGQHWRPSIHEWCWELPRGMDKTGESVRDTAVRELAEETGLNASSEQVTILPVTVHADTGMLRDRVKIAVIQFDHYKAQADTTDWELANPQWVSEPVIWQMIEQGMVGDALTLAALALWKQYEQERITGAHATVDFGTQPVFHIDHQRQDKWQALKVLEEASEVVEACKNYVKTEEYRQANGDTGGLNDLGIPETSQQDIALEIADLLQTVANLTSAYGISQQELDDAIRSTLAKNTRRGMFETGERTRMHREEEKRALSSKDL